MPFTFLNDFLRGAIAAEREENRLVAKSCNAAGFGRTWSALSHENRKLDREARKLAEVR